MPEPLKNNPPPQPSPARGEGVSVQTLRPGLAAGLLGFVLLYLNLIPLEFRELPVNEWLRQARSLPWLDISLRGRADWVANLFMFVPFGFLLSSALGRAVDRWAGKLLVASVSAVIAVGWAFCIEALQLFVPQRTVSLNDWLAGSLGGGLGIAAWLVAGDRLWKLAQDALQPGRPALLAGLTLYCLGYVLLSPFPYDFWFGAEEFAYKLRFGHFDPWIARSCVFTSRCLGQLAVESLAVIPFGMALAVWRRWPARVSTVLAAVVAGLLFGAIIEFVQFLTLSGISQGVSLLTRAAGFGMGVLVAGWLRDRRISDVRRVLRAWAIVACLPYLGGVLLVTGLVSARWGDWGAAAQQLSTLSFLPFYYHYFTTEQAAMASLLYTLALYAPVGMLLWPWHKRHSSLGLLAAVLAALLAFIIESGKLLAVGLRPDPSNVFIAAFAGWVGLRMLDWLVRSLSGGAAVARTVEPEEPRGLLKDRLERPEQVAAIWPVASSTGSESVSRTAQGLGVLLLAITLGWAVTWPVAAPWLVVALAVYAIWLWRQPAAWLLVIPALAPTLNLALYTGRFFFDELDLFLLATVAVIALRWRVGRGIIPLPRTVAWALAVFALSVAISLGIGLFPLPPADANALVNYTNNYNALREAKGFFWALLLFVLLQQSRLPAECLMQRWFVPGMVLGLMGAVAVVLWERATYPGLFDFDSSYRITGLFTDMHVGGPSIETYLVMATPFVLLWAWQHRHWAWQIPALALLAVVFYGVVVTYSRAGYLGMAVTLVVILVGALAGVVALRGPRRWRLAAVAALPMLVAGLVLPQVTGDFFERRMELLGSDTDQRVARWRLVMDLRGPGLREVVFGAGLGRFPQVYAWGNPEGRLPANFGYAKRTEGIVLRLGTGDSLFINQRLSLPHRGDYMVEITAHADRPSRLTLFICEKHVLYSFTCHQGLVGIPEIKTKNGPLLWRFNADGLATGPWFARRQLTFSFANYTEGGIIEIERLSLKSSDGRELLRNGDFSQGGRYWYFTSDHLDSWRIENQWLDVLFAQGWLGLLSFIALTLGGMLALLRTAALGVFDDACLLAALVGTLAVGVFNAVFWSPRLSLLFYLILLLGVAVSYARRRQQQ